MSENTRIPTFIGDRLESFMGIPIEDMTIEEAVEAVHHLGGVLRRAHASEIGPMGWEKVK